MTLQVPCLTHHPIPITQNPRPINHRGSLMTIRPACLRLGLGLGLGLGWLGLGLGLGLG